MQKAFLFRVCSSFLNPLQLDLEFSKRLCRLFECSCGDLVTDAMAAEMNVDIAMVNGGSMKAELQKGEKSAHVLSIFSHFFSKCKLSLFFISKHDVQQIGWEKSEIVSRAW